jgi:hypothetical protein
MTTIATATSPQPFDAMAPRWPKVAGITYVGAWVVGLTAFGAGPAANASNAEVARYFADNRVVSAAQSLLIHGVAAVALYAVLVAATRTGVFSRRAQAAGLVAVGLSLAQCVLDLWRSLLSTGSTTTTLVHAIDRIDGVKMLALAVMIGASVAGLHRAGVIGRRMAITGKAAAIALVVSGIAYAGAISSLLVAAELSLVLLLIWVGYLGFAAARRTV